METLGPKLLRSGTAVNYCNTTVVKGFFQLNHNPGMIGTRFAIVYNLRNRYVVPVLHM